LGFLSFIGICIGRLICVILRDTKVLVAYSSIVHIGVVLFLLINIRNIFIYGGLLIILGHGYISSMLFYLVGELYIIYSTRMIYKTKGLWVNIMYLCSMWQLILILNRGSPLSLSFLTEIIFISGIYLVSPWSLVLIFIYYIISFYFSLWLIIITMLGNYKGIISTIPLLFIFPLIFYLINIILRN
jgi:NADH:ubiquinone oxidoreductase subunit 4 (subunit M)